MTERCDHAGIGKTSDTGSVDSWSSPDADSGSGFGGGGASGDF